MSDVALRAGVSRQLASLVLRGEPGPSEESRHRVLDAAAALHYRPNASARLLRQPRTRLIGAMFSALNAFEVRVVELLLDRAAVHGFSVVLAPVTATRRTETAIIQLLEQRVEAIACYNPDPESPAFQRALELLPVVWMGERSADPRADVVRTDDTAGLRAVIDHLVSLGHSRIAYAGGLGGIVGPDRAQAYRDAMTGAGLADRVDVLTVGFDEEDGADAARQLLNRDSLPTAVACCSDHCAAGMFATLTRAGVAVPEDVSVVGYDDNTIAAFSFLRLTTVHQDVELTVSAAVDAILTRLADGDSSPRDIATPAPLVIRSTTAPARPARA
jgi:DNA-binding LacI/PurR family transcriptional regulator